MNSAGGSFAKNVAVSGFPFYLEHRATDAPVTAGIVTIYIIIDDGAQGTVSAAAAHKANGQWTVDLSAAEMNGDNIGLLFTHPDAKWFHISLQTGADMTRIAGNSGAATNLAGGAEELQLFLVGSGVTATSIPTNISGLPYTNPNHFSEKVVHINRETRKILSSGGSPVVLTTETFNSVPSQNDAGVIS